MVDYAKSRATAERLIKKFGGEAYLVTETPGVGGTALNPADPVPVETGIFAAIVDYTVQERQASSIEVGSRRAIVSAPSGAPEPDTSALIRFKDEQDNPTDYRIERVDPLQPGGPNEVVIFYDCQVRG